MQNSREQGRKNIIKPQLAEEIKKQNLRLCCKLPASLEITRLVRVILPLSTVISVLTRGLSQ